MVSNPKFIGQSTTLTPNQIEDSVDFPHTGLIKALNIGASGRGVISGFDITVNSNTEIAVTAGKIIYNGYIVDVNQATLPLSSSFTNGYHLIVAPKPTSMASTYSTPTVSIINPTAADKVPEYGLGDTIIGVVTHTGSTPHIQYLTYDKTENSLSLAHNNGGATYTEMGQMYATGAGIFLTQDSATNLGDITIKNADENRDIKFTLNDGGNNIDIVFDANATTLGNIPVANFGQFNIITAGTVTANGVVLTGTTVSNHGADRLITSGAANTDLIGESSLTFNGSTNILSVAGSIDVTAGTIASNGQITTQNNIAALNGAITGYTIQSNTASVNLGSRQASSELGANATSGYGIPPRQTLINASPTLANIIPTNKIIQGKYETYYIGFDSTGGSNSHDFSAGQVVINPMSIYQSGTEYTNTVMPNAENQDAGQANAHQYSQDSVFGGNAMFAGIIRPDAASNNKRVTIHNITSFAIYLVVIDPDPADPSETIMKNRVNGGKAPSTYHLHTLGNSRCVDLARILTNPTGQYFVGFNHVNDWDAILIQPRESITLQSKIAIGNEAGTEFENDVFGTQGLYSSQIPSDVSQWFVLSSSNPVGFASMSLLNTGFWNIPIHMTGTAFACNGQNEIVLPAHPPYGTQYSFMCVSGTANVNTITNIQGTLFYPSGQNELHQHLSQNVAYDTMEELSIGAGLTQISISAGNAKTFLYMVDGTWQVIG